MLWFAVTNPVLEQLWRDKDFGSWLDIQILVFGPTPLPPFFFTKGESWCWVEHNLVSSTSHHSIPDVWSSSEYYHIQPLIMACVYFLQLQKSLGIMRALSSIMYEQHLVNKVIVIFSLAREGTQQLFTGHSLSLCISTNHVLSVPTVVPTAPNWTQPHS